MDIPADVVAAHNLKQVAHVATTGIAHVWHVTRVDGTDAALKVYINRDPKDEAPGFDVMQGAPGGAARVYEYTDGVALMEWLPGPTLGDLSRNGDDQVATQALIQTASALHAGHGPRATRLRTVGDWFEALFAMTFDPTCPETLRRDFGQCADLARDLLASATDARPLHGDYHHDNVKQGPNGYRTFDAKGVMGEVAFEASNTFRNPLGADDLIRDVGRTQRLAQVWADALDTNPRRILQWAAARQALSFAWYCDGHLVPDAPDLDLVPFYLKQAALAPDKPH